MEGSRFGERKRRGYSGVLEEKRRRAVAEESPAAVAAGESTSGGRSILFHGQVTASSQSDL